MSVNPNMEEGPRRSASFAVNAVFSAASEISVILLFLLLVLAARTLGETEYGVFAFALAFVNIFGALMEGGLGFVYARAVARDPSLAERYFGNILALQLCFCLAGVLIAVIAINLGDVEPETRRVVYLLAGAESLRFIKQLYRFAFRTANRFDVESATLTVERLMLLVTGAAVLYAGYGIVGLACAFLVVRALDVLIVLLMGYRVLGSLRIRADFALWPGFIREAAPFILIAALVMLLFRIDNVMLAFMASNAEVGWFNAAYSLLEGLYIVPKIITNLLYPAFSRAHREPEAITRLLVHAMRYALLVALPVMLVGIVLAEEITLFLYGEQYVQSIVALQILLLGTFFLFMHEIGFVLLGAIDRQKVAVMLFALALLVKIVVNMWLIPRLGYVGAAYGTVVAEGVFALIAIGYLAQLGYRASLTTLSIKPLVAAGVAAIVAHMVTLQVLVLLPLVAAVYLVMLTLLRFWQADDISAFTRVVTGFQRKFFS